MQQSLTQVHLTGLIISRPLTHKLYSQKDTSVSSQVFFSRVSSTAEYSTGERVVLLKFEYFGH